MSEEKLGVYNTVGIVTSHHSLVALVMENIQLRYPDEVSSYRKTLNDSDLYLKDGTRFLSFDPNRMSAGKRLTYALIDNTINDIDVLETIVYPMCNPCQGKKVFYFSDSQDATSMAFNIINTIREERYSQSQL